MGPCLAVAVLNHTQMRAWVAHGSGWSVAPATFDEMMSDAYQSCRSADALTIWIVGGCTPVDDEGFVKGEGERGSEEADDGFDLDEPLSGETELTLADQHSS